MASMTPTLLTDLHVKFIKELDTKKDELEYWVAEHLRLSGVYWAITALDLMNNLDALDKEEVIAFVLKCHSEREPGGFGGHPNHDAHLLYTLCAVQILATYDALDKIDVEKTVQYVKALQEPASGAFRGDGWGEVDTRFSYCALSCLSLLGRLDAVDVAKAVKFVDKCKNFDGGYGRVPGAESHSGQRALAIADSLHLIDAEQLGWWLSERQLKNGGLNGRPEKLEDDTETGGIADRPGDYPDVFHTIFGVAGLSLLGYPGLKEVDPRYCMPRYVTERLGLPKLFGMYRRKKENMEEYG
ncbi:hypothetical protein HK104_009946 [Borealophlyctis nickersoniae]|nr:hypothetical protein HK104_009946 [Borealophlyctis nickersoniae]